MTYPFRAGIAVAVTIFLAAACQTQEPEQAGTTEDAAAIDAESVRQNIETSNDRFEQAVLAGDSDALAGLYTADGVVLGPFMPRAEGTESVRSFWSGMMEEGPPTDITLTTDDVTVAESGDIAYEIGSYDIAGTTPEGTAWQEQGKYLVIWENENGEWKIAADIWNSDTAPPGMEGAAPAQGEAPAGTPPATEDTGTTEETGTE